jgi:hypothetical protein
MQYQRLHEQSVRRRGRNHNFFATSAEFLGLGVIEDTIDVRSWHDTKRATLSWAIVDVESNGCKLLQHRDWRLDEDAALLLGPARELWRLDLAAHRNTAVLV